MPPFTRQEQRQSLRADNASVTERALQQMLEDFDNYKRMMTIQNRDIIKTNIFGQQRIRHLEDQVTALEEKITIQAAAKTKAAARAMQLEHELACIHVAFDFMSSTLVGQRRHTPTTSHGDYFKRGMPQPPPLPAAPAHGKSNPVRPLTTEVPATVVKNVSRPPSFALGRVQEELSSAQPPHLSPERNSRSHFVFGSHLGTVDESAAYLYPPLPSPTPTDNSSAPSPVRTPDLDFPIGLPLNLHRAGSAQLAGLNIRIEAIEGQDQNFFQPVRLSNRPNLNRSDSASWSIDTPVQASPDLPQESEVVSESASGANSGAQVQTSSRVTVRKRMQGRTSGLIQPVPAQTTPASPLISTWTLTESTHSANPKDREKSEGVQSDRRQALADTSNLQKSPEKGAGSPMSGKQKPSSLSIMVNTERDSNRYEHVDTPLLRSSLRLEDENRVDAQVAEEELGNDRFATVPTGRKRKTASSAVRPVRVRSRSEDGCVCGKVSTICTQTGTKHHACGCNCSPCTCPDLQSPIGTSGPSEPGSATPRGQHLPLQLQQSRSLEQVQSTAKALAAMTQQDAGGSDVNDSDRNLGNLQETEPEDTSEAESGRPTRRARSSVNYALPKLNTKMRKPESSSTATDPLSRANASSRPSESASLSAKSGKRMLATTTLRNAALSAAVQHNRKSTSNGMSLLSEGIPQHQRARSRSSSSDVSIMSYTSGSSGTPIIRSPPMAGSAEDKGKWTPSMGTSATLASAAAKLDSAVAMIKQDSEGTVKGELATIDESGLNRSAGQATFVPADPSSSSSSDSPSDPPASQSTEQLPGTVAESSSRSTRRSSAAVNYALPKLNTKLRKPEAEDFDAVARPKSTNLSARRKTTTSHQPLREAHDSGGQSSGDESVTSEPRTASSRNSDSAGVSAAMAYYSNRTLRKSTIAPASYALPKLNTKMRKPEAQHAEGGSAPAESPKRKTARKAMSSSSLKTAATSTESETTSSAPVPITLTTRSLGRTTGASTLSGPSALLPSPSIFAPNSPRTSLHAMLTHPPRERSGSSTSSGSTVRGGNSRMEAVWSSHEEQQEDEDEEDNDDEEEYDVEEDEDEVEAHASLRADRSKAEESDSENDEDDGDEEDDGVEGEADGHWYDDRMDPYRFSSDSPSCALRAELKASLSPALRAVHTDASVGGADSTAGEISGCAVGSVSFGSDLSAYDSTVTYV